MAGATNPRGLYSGFALWVLGFRVRKSISTKQGGVLFRVCSWDFRV